MLPAASENWEEVSLLLLPPLQESFLGPRATSGCQPRAGGEPRANTGNRRARRKAAFLQRREVDSKMAYPEVQEVVRTIHLDNMGRKQQEEGNQAQKCVPKSKAGAGERLGQGGQRERRQGKELTKRQKWEEERGVWAGCGLQLVARLPLSTFGKRNEESRTAHTH